MTDRSQLNPFERFDIDALAGPAAITERLRELAEAATDENERRAIRAAWEELTLHPLRRLTAALGAHPQGHPPLGGLPPAPRLPDVDLARLEPRDLALRPSPLSALGPVSLELPDVPLDRDPFLMGDS